MLILRNIYLFVIRIDDLINAFGITVDPFTVIRKGEFPAVAHIKGNNFARRVIRTCELRKDPFFAVPTLYFRLYDSDARSKPCFRGTSVCFADFDQNAPSECSGGHGDVFAAALYRISRLTVRSNKRVSGLHRRIEHHSVAHTEPAEKSAAHA